MRFFVVHMNRLTRCLPVLVLSLLLPVVCGRAAETNSAPAGRAEDTNTQEIRTYLQLQEQLHATQLAIEQTRLDAANMTARNTELLTKRLQAIEQALSTQRAGELEAMQRANRVMLIVAGAFASAGITAMLLMAWFQWRTIHGLAAITTGLPVTRAAGGAGPAALGAGELRLLSAGPAEQSNAQLLAAIEQLERRMRQLEVAAHPGLAGPAYLEPGKSAKGNGDGQPSARPTAAAADDPTSLLLGRAEALLLEDKPQAALECFQQVLDMSPNHLEALVKKGLAFERLSKPDAALECYDRAIALDSSSTIAYLQKAGLLNRMERFSEALDCYEKALHSHEKRVG